MVRAARRFPGPDVGRRASWALGLGVAAVWCAVYVLAAWPRLSGPLPAAVLLAYGALPTPFHAAQWPRLVTTWLVHIDPLHLLGNLAAWGVAWLPWPAPRGAARHRLVALGSCGLVASLTVVLWYGQHPAISVGPSGALLGLLLVPSMQRGAAPGSRGVWLVASAALLIGGALTGGDTAAHLGGALAGLGLGLFWRARETSHTVPDPHG